MEIERAPWGYRIGRDCFRFSEIERVCSDIDEAIAITLPKWAMTIGVIDFILDHYKERLRTKPVILIDKASD